MILQPLEDISDVSVAPDSDGPSAVILRRERVSLLHPAGVIRRPPGKSDHYADGRQRHRDDSLRSHGRCLVGDGRRRFRDDRSFGAQGPSVLHQTFMRPSTTTSMPVMYELSSQDKNRATSATSS